MARLTDLPRSEQKSLPAMPCPRFDTRPWVEPVTTVALEIDEVLGAFFRGQFLVMIALGLIYAIGLMLVGLQAAFLSAWWPAC